MGGSCEALGSKAFVLSQKERQMCEVNPWLGKTDSQCGCCMDTVVQWVIRCEGKDELQSIFTSVHQAVAQ